MGGKNGIGALRPIGDRGLAPGWRRGGPVDSLPSNQAGSDGGLVADFQGSGRDLLDLAAPAGTLQLDFAGPYDGTGRAIPTDAYLFPSSLALAAAGGPAEVAIDSASTGVFGAAFPEPRSLLLAGLGGLGLLAIGRRRPTAR